MLPRKLADYERSLKPRLSLVPLAPKKSSRIPWLAIGVAMVVLGGLVWAWRLSR